MIFLPTPPPSKIKWSTLKKSLSSVQGTNHVAEFTSDLYIQKCAIIFRACNCNINRFKNIYKVSKKSLNKIMIFRF
jgi:hypothetical protein